MKAHASPRDFIAESELDEEDDFVPADIIALRIVGRETLSFFAIWE